ncbi:uncharacterized protein LOC117646157 [Thrips palmi]|uniref:Uncharacterized protein LOC117646157 n=1 Tax=Thrips palmi TaxID=161013 RepID=A0A6P8YS11_THRPL|nr:uncharacterized protein LOC117646157 [Thrips palmi]
MQQWFLVFGALLPVLYGFFKYWKRTHIKVNCWFCGLNNTILRKCHDGWMCKHCEQYNGFKPDGDYNREIPAQYDSSLNGRLSFCFKPQPYNKSPQNGFCQDCNRNQELKVAQLASFQPINPDNFDQEIDNFSYHLERAYRLCPPCEAVLDETLSLKKTHILDMNLQVTGKKTISGVYSSSKLAFNRILVKTTTLMTTSIALILLLHTLSSMTTDHIVFSASNFFDNKGISISRATCAASPFAKLLAAPAMCPKTEGSSAKTTKILPRLIGESVDLHYLEVVGPYSAPLSFSGWALQIVAFWQSGRRLATLPWAALFGIEVFLSTSFGTNYAELCQVAKILFTLLILTLSLPLLERSKPVSPFKKGTLSFSKQIKRKSESFQKVPATNPQPSFGQDQIRSNAQSSLFKPNVLRNVNQNEPVLQGPNYLTLPTRPSHSSLSNLSLADSLLIPPPAEFQNTATQEDARSDASVDSAFSNPDSITLDAAESLNSSFYVNGKKPKTQDDVQSLIEGLSIGSLSSNHNLKTPSEFRTKSYGKEPKRSSLLCPSRLSNIMNESISSGIWRNTRSNTVVPSDARSNVTLTSASEIAEASNRTLSRPGSPCGSVHSQATARTAASVRSFSPPSSFQPYQPTQPYQSTQPVVSSWSSPPSPKSTLAVCVPPNPLSPNPEFGSIPSPIPNSHVSQVIYTPYGMYHPMMSPYGNSPMFMMPPQASPFGNRSPASSFGSQFSPRSFSTSSRFCDSDHDLDFSPKSTKGKSRNRECLSSSFLGSVWQSRFAIMYTTLCYLLLGSLVCAFSYSGLIPSVFSKVSNWKHNVFSL